MSKTVLLIDDEPVLLQTARLLLRQSGFHVIPAADATQGLEILARHGGIDLIITDHNMPERTGLELAQQLAETDHTVPIILTSSMLTEELIAAGRAAGIRGFLDKPYDPAALCGLAWSLV